MGLSTHTPGTEGYISVEKELLAALSQDFHQTIDTTTSISHYVAFHDDSCIVRDFRQILARLWLECPDDNVVYASRTAALIDFNGYTS
jgi:hypothetical protein